MRNKGIFMQSQQLTLVILAAGIGSRYGGIKQLQSLDLEGRTLIDYSLRDALDSNFTDIVFVITHKIAAAFREQIVNKWQEHCAIRCAYQEIDDIPCTVAIPAERQKPWGTAHALLCAQQHIQTPFAMMNADDYYGKNSLKLLSSYLQSLSVQSKNYALVTYSLGNTLSPHGTVSRGVCEIDTDNRLSSICEYTALAIKDRQVYNDNLLLEQVTDNTPVSMNLWGFTPQIFPWLHQKFVSFLQDPQVNLAKDEYLLPQAVQWGIQAQRFAVTAIATADRWVGVTYRQDLPWVQQHLRNLVE